MAIIFITKQPDEYYYKDEGGSKIENSQTIKFKIISKNMSEKVQISLDDSSGPIKENSKYKFELWLDGDKEEIKNSYIFYLTCNKEYILNFRYDLCSRNNQQRPYKVRFLINKKDFFSKEFFVLSKRKKNGVKRYKIKNFDIEENKSKKLKQNINNQNLSEITNCLKLICNSLNDQNKLLRDQNSILIKILNDKKEENNVLNITNNYCNHDIESEDSLFKYPMV